MKYWYLCLPLVLCLFSIRANAQKPELDGHIVEFHLDGGKPDWGGDGATSVVVTYDDGTCFVENLPKKKGSGESGNTGDTPSEFSNAHLAPDKQTLGWTIAYEGCCQSYAIPETLLLYKQGKVIHEIRQGQMLWYWEFVNDGSQVATIWGPTHGTSLGDYRLYDVASGQLLEEPDDGNPETGELSPSAPTWARKLKFDMDHQSNK